MEYINYFQLSSSSTKMIKLMIMAIMLLILTSSGTVLGQNSCGSRKPAAVGVCKDDYASCVANVITVLRDRTAYTKNQRFDTAYPLNGPSGGVVGQAACVDGSSFAECQRSLSAAKKWLEQNCGGSSAGGTFSDRICSMAYGQLSR